jgi:hypothetical protein
MILVFAGAGIWLLFTGIKGFLLKRKHLPHMERVQGTVIDVERKVQGTSTQRGKKVTTYSNFPVIQFTRPSGEVVKFTSEAGDITRRRASTMALPTGSSIETGSVKTTKSEYQTGDTLAVLYDPDGAVKPMVDRGSNIWMSEIYMMLGGGAFVAVAVFIIAVFGGRIIAEMPF